MPIVPSLESLMAQAEIDLIRTRRGELVYLAGQALAHPDISGSLEAVQRAINTQREIDDYFANERKAARKGK